MWIHDSNNAWRSLPTLVVADYKSIQRSISIPKPFPNAWLLKKMKAGPLLEGESCGQNDIARSPWCAYAAVHVRIRVTSLVMHIAEFVNFQMDPHGIKWTQLKTKHIPWYTVQKGAPSSDPGAVLRPRSRPRTQGPSSDPGAFLRPRMLFVQIPQSSGKSGKQQIEFFYWLGEYARWTWVKFGFGTIHWKPIWAPIIIY